MWLVTPTAVAGDDQTYVPQLEPAVPAALAVRAPQASVPLVRLPHELKEDTSESIRMAHFCGRDADRLFDVRGVDWT